MKTSDRITARETVNKNRKNGFDKMEAIAFGVRARFEESTGYAKKITDSTVGVARALGVPQKEIDKWLEARSTRISSEMEKLKAIKAILENQFGSSLGL